jgi:general stress protein 26
MAKDKAGKAAKAAKAEKAEKAADKGGDAKKLRKLVKGARVAMLTTCAPDGALRSRPMAAVKAPFDGDLWFFTRAAASKTQEIRDNDHVNVAFADHGDDRYLSVSGRASVVRDAARIEELWSKKLRAWFPEGKKDPDLALLRVRIERAEYWDSKKAGMVALSPAAPSAPAPAAAAKARPTEPVVDQRKGDPGMGGTTPGSGAQG